MPSQVHYREGYIEVQLDPGTANAFELGQTFRHLRWEHQARCILVRSTGGAISTWTGYDADFLTFQVPAPIIFAWEGHLTRDAAVLALSCDIRLCADTASLTLADPDDCDDQGAFATRLETLAGFHDPFPIGIQLTASGLYDRGLVSSILPHHDFDNAVTDYCNLIASRAPIALRLAKEAIWRGLNMPLEQGLRFETDLTLLLQSTKDRAEGVAAFKEKRQPAFKGE